ncbi:HAD-IA family hydrolase [Amycolatopsis sp. OK19-0408]|uniref:HAD-IA family hydrolase n=1 Tax=Amycolatopsis iheyensis TaxID=2945988 RepID=A0A9X2NHP8_9PSEU|nr:HAD-IA family hydrolase [Amycolatopsis iheyensis]MCR6488038.1 HAD-IA family hydrolase [Amycolatopsis iheyensis]
MPDALVMDLFGVFTRFDNDIVPARLAKHCADPEDAVRRLAGLMARREVITGRVTLADIHERLIAKHGYTRPYADFEEAWLTPYSGPMPGMAELVGPLAERCRLVLLSNVDAYCWRVVRAMQPELGRFDEVLLSCDLGLAKPDPEIFRRASLAAGAPPERCLFVDDTLVNVEAAAALGFRTHWFRGVAGFRAMLGDEAIPSPHFNI